MPTIMSLLSVAKKIVPLPVKVRLHRLRNKIPRKLNLSWALKSGLNVRVTSESDWVIYNDIFVEGEYDQPIAEALQSVGTTGKINVLDLGANVGFFTLRFLDILRQQGPENVPYQITAVEGSPTVKAELDRRLHHDNHLPEVRIVHGLIGERSGSAKIADGDFHAMNSLYFDATAATVEVDFVDLNTLFGAEEEIDLLKCDIEGAELLFIENYQELLRRTRTAVFELHPNRCDTERCKKILADLGFTRQKDLRVTASFCVSLFSR